MITRRLKFYLLSGIGCVTGYLWLLLHSHWFFPGRTVCFLKNITGLPCPACGATRSVVELLHGHLGSAFLINPLGYVVAAILLVFPCWMAIDLFLEKRSLVHVYHWAEEKMKKPGFAIPAIGLLLLNWMWNFKKGF
jgi:hypothetical protein